MKRLLTIGFIFLMSWDTFGCKKILPKEPIVTSLPEFQMKPLVLPTLSCWLIKESQNSMATRINIQYISGYVPSPKTGMLIRQDNGLLGKNDNGFSEDVFRYLLEFNIENQTYVITPNHDSVKGEPIIKGSYYFEGENFFTLKDENNQIVYKLEKTQSRCN